MKKKLLPFLGVAVMIFGLLSGRGLNVRAEDETGEKVVNLRCKSDGTEVSEVTTFDNILPYSDSKGYVYGKYGADAAYLGEEEGKIKFMISGVVGLVDPQDVLVCDLEGSNVSYYKVADGKLLHNISENLNGSDLYELTAGSAPPYLDEGVTYYSYDGHYFYDDYSVMLKDYGSETRDNSVNPDNSYYNYYQYLPLRTRTVYTGDELTGILNSKVGENSKLNGLGGCFADNQDKYGINALLTAGIAVNESAWGMSALAQNKNNLFGLNAVDSDPKNADTFDSPEQCVEEFAKEWMSKGYADPGDWRYNGLFLGDKASGINVRYASDPYWGEKAANIVWKLDAENDVARQDRYTYTIGIKDTINDSGNFDLNVRKQSSTDPDSTVIYTTGRRPYYPFVILGEENGFYKVQSDPPLTKDRNGIDTGTGEYDFEEMYLYISKDYITLVNGEVPEKPQEPEELKGDVNRNGKVDIIDARWLLQVSSGNRTLTDEQNAVADVNDDTKINIIDARWLLQVSSGNRTL